MCARHLSPVLSIVVIGRNQESRLISCLESLHHLHGIEGTLETIYIDLGSTDASIEQARALDAHVIELSAEATLATAHNIGWRTSRGDFILFIDSMGKIHPDFPIKALEALHDRDVAVVCGNCEDSIFGCSTSEIGVCEEEAVIRRNALDEVRGFEKSLMAGDLPDLCRRIRSLGHRIVRLPLPILSNDKEQKSFKAQWRRYFHRGIAYAQISKRFAASTDPMWQYEAHRNFWEGSLLVIGIPFLIVLALVLQSWLPIALIGVILAILVIACKGVRRVLSQIPIFFGQLYYRFWIR